MTLNNDVNLAASNLLSKLSEKPSMSTIINNTNQLCDAYIEIAMTVPPSLRNNKPKSTQSSIAFERKLKITSIQDTEIPIITLELPVEIDHDKQPLIIGFQKHYKLVGGINAPKVFNCIGSDGKMYTQLVKGGSDDL
jgi:serine-protein kinase ATM